MTLSLILGKRIRDKLYEAAQTLSPSEAKVAFAATVLQGITVTEGTDYFDSNSDLRSLANRSYLENGF